MKKLIIVLSLFILIQCSSMNHAVTNIENGLLYGKNKGFFPQTGVFICIKDSMAFTEGFYPLKGMLFSTFTDTLYYSAEKNIFSNGMSTIYLENNKLYFERTDSLQAFRVEKTRLKYEQKNEKKYSFFKEKAVSYSSFWNQE